MKVWQEFYCTKSGGGCGGYFMIPLNLGLNCRVKIVCPKCAHEHHRNIVNGEIKESGRFDSKPVEDIIAPLSAYSEKPKSALFTNGGTPKQERDSAVVTAPAEVAPGMWQRWIERFGGGTDKAQE